MVRKRLGVYKSKELGEGCPVGWGLADVTCEEYEEECATSAVHRKIGHQMGKKSLLILQEHPTACSFTRTLKKPQQPHPLTMSIAIYLIFCMAHYKSRL